MRNLAPPGSDGAVLWFLDRPVMAEGMSRFSPAVFVSLV